MSIQAATALFILCSLSQQLEVQSSGISKDCMQCICNIESNCRPLDCSWDVYSLSCGYYQIKLPYYTDCGMPGKAEYETVENAWKKCAKDKSCADTCVKKYMKRYGKYCTRGRTPTCEDYARIHNGGPKGCRRSATNAYWNKVQKCCKTKDC